MENIPQSKLYNEDLQKAVEEAIRTKAPVWTCIKCHTQYYVLPYTESCDLSYVICEKDNCEGELLKEG